MICRSLWQVAKFLCNLRSIVSLHCVEMLKHQTEKLQVLLNSFGLSEWCHNTFWDFLGRYIQLLSTSFMSEFLEFWEQFLMFHMHSPGLVMFLQVSNLLVTPFFKSVQKHQLQLYRYNSLCPHCFPLTYSMSDETVSLMDLMGFSRTFYSSLLQESQTCLSWTTKTDLNLI